MSSANASLSYLHREETDPTWQFFHDGVLIELPQPRRRRLMADTIKEIIAYSVLVSALVATTVWRQVRWHVSWPRQIIFVTGAVLFSIALLRAMLRRHKLSIEPDVHATIVTMGRTLFVMAPCKQEMKTHIIEQGDLADLRVRRLSDGIEVVLQRASSGPLEIFIRTASHYATHLEFGLRAVLGLPRLDSGPLDEWEQFAVDRAGLALAWDIQHGKKIWIDVQNVKLKA